MTEYLPYKIAKNLKEIGFDEPCIFYIDENENEFIYDYKVHPNEFIELCGGNVIKTPLYRQAFRWLRNNYKIKLLISDNYFWIHGNGSSETKSYEEAEIKCLEKVIEMIKKNNNL